MNNKLIFRKGPESELPLHAKDNELLFTEDTGRIFKGHGDDKALIHFSDIVEYESIEALRLANPAITGKLYAIGTSVYMYDKTDYVLVFSDDSMDKYHTHTNKSVIDKFSVDANGKLLFDGKSIEIEIPEVVLPTWATLEGKPAKVVTDIAKSATGITVSYDDSSTKEIEITGGTGDGTTGFVASEFGATEW